MGTFSGREAVIFLAAPETQYDYVKTLLAQLHNPYVVCADGGLRHAQALGLRPQLMISDRDSMTELAGDEIIALRPEKDDTDAQACLRACIARGMKRVHLVCASGGRMDHMLANLSLLEEAEKHGVTCCMHDAQNEVHFHGGGSEIYTGASRFSYFSIIPLDETLKGVSIFPAKYPLDHATVSRAGLITVSNEPVGDSVQIAIQEGSAYVIFSRD